MKNENRRLKKIIEDLTIELKKVDNGFSKKLNIVSQGKNGCRKGKNIKLSISF